MRSSLKKPLSIMLTVCMVAALFPALSVPVSAGGTNITESERKSLLLGHEILGSGSNTANAATLWYGQYDASFDNIQNPTPLDWRVIGYNGTGVATAPGDMTLLAKTNLTRFSTGGIHVKGIPYTENYNNIYAVSLVKSFTDAVASSFSQGELAAVKSRDLAVGEFTLEWPYCDGVSLLPVNDAKLWSLSAKEADQTDLSIRSLGSTNPAAENFWWLRSPGSGLVSAAYVTDSGGVGLIGVSVGNSTFTFGVRPAFNLELEDILFTSSATGKNSGASVSNALTAVGTYSGPEWKLTLKDESRSGFSIATTSLDHGAEINYYGAKTGSNEYISAVVMDSNDNILYYGRVKNLASPWDSQGSVSIHIPEGVELSTTTTLRVFNEQYNGDKRTDYASELKTVQLSGNAPQITTNFNSALITKNDDGRFGCISIGTDDWRILNYALHEGAAPKFLLLLDRQDRVTDQYITAFNSGGSTAWEGSDAQGWCTQYMASRLSGLEQEGMQGTDGNKMFFLTKEQAETYLTTAAVRIQRDFVNQKSVWWLGSFSGGRVDCVDGDGEFGSKAAGETAAARPAMNYSMENVVMISADSVAGKGKGNYSDHTRALQPVSTEETSTWKLTLLDESRTLAVTQAALSAQAGKIVSFDYRAKGAAQSAEGYYGRKEYISGIILDERGHALYYGKLAELPVDEGEVSGTAIFRLANTLTPGTYTLKLFSESCSSRNATDYAGAFDKLELTITEPGIEIYGQPSANLVVTGDSGKLKVAAGATDGRALYYQWYSCDDANKAGVGELLSGDSSLTVSRPADGEKKYYFCRIGAQGLTDVDTRVCTVSAGDGSPSLSLGSAALGISPNTDAAASVYFSCPGYNRSAGWFPSGDHSIIGGDQSPTDDTPIKWRIVGYKGTGVISGEGNMTLLADECVTRMKSQQGFTVIDLGGGRIMEIPTIEYGIEPRPFWRDANDESSFLRYSNAYYDSLLRGEMDEQAFGLTVPESAAVIERNLPDVGVSDAQFWALSAAEAETIDPSLLAVSEEPREWWLRSSGSIGSTAAYVSDIGVISTYGAYCGDEKGTRPTINLDPERIIFTSLAEGGKQSGQTDDEGNTSYDGSLTAVGSTTSTAWKLTLRDETRNAFEAAPVAYDEVNRKITVQYGGAKTGANEYISAVIVNDAGSILHYGRLKNLSGSGDSAGSAVAIIPAGVTLGADATLKVFNEQYNSDKRSDYASELKEIGTAVTAWPVSYNLINTTTNGTALFPKNSLVDYTATLTPKALCRGPKPEHVVVTVGGEPLEQGKGYSFDPGSGLLTIPRGKITAAVEITAYCGQNQSRIFFSPGEHGYGATTLEIKYYEKPLKLYGATYTREGFAQIGWATEDYIKWHGDTSVGNTPVTPQYELEGEYTWDVDAWLYPVWGEYNITVNNTVNDRKAHYYGVRENIATVEAGGYLGYEFDYWRVDRGDVTLDSEEIGEAVLTFFVPETGVVELTAVYVPVSVSAPDISTGTRGLPGYSVSLGYNYIYFGSQDGENLKWRILSDAGNGGDYQNAAGSAAENALLLLSETTQGLTPFNKEMTGSAWQGSAAQGWCMDFAGITPAAIEGIPPTVQTVTDAFSEGERKAVLKTSRSDPAFDGAYYEAANILFEDRVFFLSAEEATRRAYGLDIGENRIVGTTGASLKWWTRSPGNKYYNYYSVGAVLADGEVDNSYWVTDTDIYARPAFNLDGDAVLFASKALGGKNDAVDQTLTAVATVDTTDWKLTLLDSSRSLSVARTPLRGQKGDVLSIDFTGATMYNAATAPNEYLSALITDGYGQALYYGRLAQPATANGRVSFTIPDGIGAGTYSLNVFSEQCNGDYKTDYASAFATVELTVEPVAGYGIELSPSGDKTFSSVAEGNAAPAAHSVTVSGIGANPTGALTVTLTGDDRNDFELSTTTLPSLARHEEASFTVAPEPGLAQGTYSAVVTVSGGNAISASFTVSFTVTPAVLTQLEVSTPPTLSYDDGETLDLSAMVITAIYSNGDSMELDHEDEGVTVSIAHGEALEKGEHDDESLTVSFGGQTVTVGSLVVRSTDAGVSSVSVGGTAGTISGTAITVVLPVGTAGLPAETTDVAITTKDADAVVSGIETADNGTNWTFTVTAESGDATAYTVNVSIAADIAAQNAADLAAVRSAIEFRSWSLPQATANTEETVLAWIEEQLDSMALNGVTYVVTMSRGFVPAERGSAQDADGTAGSFGFSVALTKGEDPDTATGTATVIGGAITATRYVAYLLTVEGGSGGGSYEAGEEITITADDRPGHTFSHWTTDAGQLENADAAQTLFTMPSSAATVTANYTANPASKRIAKPAITIPVTGGRGSVEVPVTVTDGVADVAITDGQLDEIISGGGAVVLDGSGLENVNSVRVPSELVDAASSLEIILPAGGVSLDKTALDSLPGGEDLTVSVELVHPSQLESGQRSLLGDGAESAIIVDVTVLAGGIPVSDYNGGAIKVSIPYTPREGEDASKLSVWYLADDGNIELIECVYNAQTGCAEFYTTHLSQYVVVHFPFDDVAEDAWYYFDVTYAYNNGLFLGTADTTFDPALTMTRTMIVTVLWRRSGSPAATGANPFEDVAAGLWYTDAVLWAAEKGIVDGYGDGRFGPGDVITREQLATILYRYAMFKGYDVSVGEDTNILSYDDAFTISEYAIPALQWACGAGLMQGDNANLMPKKSAQRCQVAAILHRFCENVK